MNAVKKNRIKTVMMYTWPLYLVLGVIAVLTLNFIFGVVHRTPNYKKLTIFVSGEVTDTKGLDNYLLDRYADKDLKSVSYVNANPSESNYNTILRTNGVNSSDILIINASRLNDINLSAFALDLSNELITSYYQGYTLYQDNETNYGVKLDKEKVKQYMTLPDEDCYMFLNYVSENIGQYSKSKNAEHNNALDLVREWGM